MANTPADDYALVIKLGVDRFIDEVTRASPDGARDERAALDRISAAVAWANSQNPVERNTKEGCLRSQAIQLARLRAWIIDKKVGEAIRLIEADGWIHVRSRGIHQQFKHSIKRGLVTLPHKLDDDLAPGAADSILEHVGLR